MANKPTSAQGNNNPDVTSTAPYQAWDAQQAAILQANQQRQLAEQRANEQGNRAAQNRPGGENNILNPVQGLKVKYVGMPTTSGSNVKSRKKR